MPEFLKAAHQQQTQAANTCCILQPFTAHYLVVMHPSVETPEKSSTSMLWRTRGAKLPFSTEDLH